MRKIHVLTRKEEIAEDKLTQCTVIIIDVLLATSSIAAALHHGAKEVIPALDEHEARNIQQSLLDGTYVLSGEKSGYELRNFHYPNPLEWEKMGLDNKTLVLCTTNGTVAIRKSSLAKRIYTSSFLNGAAVASHIKTIDDNSSVLIVCSGSDTRLALEDFLGAGYLISELMNNCPNSWHLSDSAKAAFWLFQAESYHIEDRLQDSETGHLLANLGYEQTIQLASQMNKLKVVPLYINDRIIDVQQLKAK